MYKKEPIKLTLMQVLRLQKERKLLSSTDVCNIVCCLRYRVKDLESHLDGIDNISVLEIILNELSELNPLLDYFEKIYKKNFEYNIESSFYK